MKERMGSARSSHSPFIISSCSGSALEGQPTLGFRPPPGECKAPSPRLRPLWFRQALPLRHDFALRGFVGLRSAGALQIEGIERSWESHCLPPDWGATAGLSNLECVEIAVDHNETNGDGLILRDVSKSLQRAVDLFPYDIKSQRIADGQLRGFAIETG